jgi:3',5'-cyclic AMP phosphodiesterase CpdA
LEVAAEGSYKAQSIARHAATMTFVLAHLSDPHLGPLPKPRVAELAGKRILGFANWQRRRRVYHRSDVLAAIVADMRQAAPDHVAVTGDLINIALEAEFAPALRWLASLGSAADVTFVPGNHDAYVRSKARHSLLHWGSHMRHDDPLPNPLPLAGEGREGANVPEYATHFPFLRRRGPLALIGLSTAVPTAPFLATGRLGHEQLMRLSDLLPRLRKEPLFRVVLIHHPPLPKPSDRAKHLVDAAAFRRVIAEHGAELILHGHDHVHAVTWLDGPTGRVPAVGVPSASGALDGDKDPAGYNLYSIGGAPSAWRCEAVSRGLRHGRDGVVELTRRMLIGAS